MLVGVAVFVWILSSADFGLLASVSDNSLWLVGLMLVFANVLLQSVTFGVVASVEFADAGKFFFFWRKGLQATVANAGVPLSGSASKVAALKVNHNIPIIDGTRTLVNVAGARGFAASFLIAMTSPSSLELKLVAILLLAVAVIIWLWVIPRKPQMRLLRPFQPLTALKIPKFSAAIWLAESSFLLLGSVTFWILTGIVGIELDFATIVFIHGAGLLVTLLPITPLGLGTRDAVIFGLMATFSINSEVAASFILLERTLLLVSVFFVWILATGIDAKINLNKNKGA